jgi:hypothetical protein
VNHSLALGSVALAAAACGCGKGVDRERAKVLFTEVTVDTRPGLSGLAADDSGGLWTVSERGGEVYRITLDPQLVPTIETFAVTGTPADTDLEGIEVLGGGKFAFGTEGKLDGIATVLTATQHAGVIEIDGAIQLPAPMLGVVLESNHGAEGVCGEGDTIIAGIEATGTQDGKRWAPMVRIAGGKVIRVHKLWLTTTTGKISGLDCRIAASGTVTGWAIERHFAVTKVLRFTLPPPGQGDDWITPVEALDLGPILNSRLNLEGIAESSDGRVAAVVDNQWKKITGPSELLVFKPGVLGTDRLPASP